MVRYTREGPGNADVTAFEATDEEPEGLTGFRIT
jgi:hypothetical protein